MSTDSTAMLRQLGQLGRVNPAQATPAQAQPSGVQPGEFTELLRRAREGSLSSSRPVEIESGSGLKLSDDQLARLSLAADRAEAGGLRKALVMIDDQRVILDVHQRTVVGAAGTKSGILDGIDGVIDLAGVLNASEAAPAPVGPPTALDSPSLSRLLAQRDRRGQAA